MFSVVLLVSLLASQTTGQSESCSDAFRQLFLQQEYTEEFMRTSGRSGVKAIRKYYDGTLPYQSPHYTSESAIAIHNHGEYVRTIGMGEVTAVLNGIEFRTRHNDHRMVMPHSTETSLHAVEAFPLPRYQSIEGDSIEDQISQMRDVFKAWRDQNNEQIDYRPYFPAALCYLEGAWFDPDQAPLESFTSFRHHVDAKDFQDLEEKVAFTSYNGRRDHFENFPHLPRRVLRMENGEPVFAQFNYRILCHPLKNDLPTNRMRLVDDLAVRVGRNWTLEEYANSRAARFRLNLDDSDVWQEGVNEGTLLDDLMAEIPGKNNYQGNMQDEVFGQLAYDIRSTRGNDIVLNAAYYHRWFRTKFRNGNFQSKRRGYSDDGVFMAMTDQPEVVGQKVTVCDPSDSDNCEDVIQKWTYAIPLEIIYMTPLSRWDPYNIGYKGHAREAEGQTVTENGENGSEDNPYNGANSDKYFLTPAELFDGGELLPTSADSCPSEPTYVLDQDGEAHATRGSGHRIFIPNIPGVGVLRQRYPIFSVFQEGSAAWKEIEALKTLRQA